MEEEESCEEGLPAWMATFSDMCTLLLTFFVLLLSFANMDVHNFKVAMGSVREAMGVQFKVPGDFEGLTTSPVELSPVQTGDNIRIDEFSNEMVKVVKKYVAEKGLEKDVEVIGTKRGVVLRTRDTVLFDTGSDALLQSSGAVLQLVKELFAQFSGELSVQGHTDSVPISSARFPSNWELSSARATAVLRSLMEDHGLERRRLHVAGYADTKPVVVERTKEDRALNRRVEFLFEFPPTEDGPQKMFRMLINRGK